MSQRRRLFPEADKHPSFFDNNLRDPDRVIRRTAGSKCWARAFYFQLMKLAFQIETEQRESSEYLQPFGEIVKQLYSEGLKGDQLKEIEHALQTVKAFFTDLLNRGDFDFQSAIEEDRSIDKALLLLLDRIVEEGGYGQDECLDKIKYLGAYFQLDMDEADSGIQFTDSDTFLYIENEQCIYMAFVEIGQLSHSGSQVQAANNSNSSLQHQQQITQQGRQFASERPAKPSPIDYLASNKFGAQKNADAAMVPVDSIEKKQNQGNSSGHMQFTLGARKSPAQVHQNSSSQFKSEATLRASKNFSIVYRNNIPDFLVDSSKKSEASQKKELFYRPQTAKTGLTSLQEGRGMNKDALDLVQDSEKGTFYRKFTDSRILGLLGEPYRTKIKLLKNRFIGVRSRQKSFLP